MGNRLASIAWTDPYADLDWRLGVCGFVPPNGDMTPVRCNASDVVTKVRHHATGRTADLPLGFHPTVEEIGAAWQLAWNYSFDDVVLRHSETKAQTPLKTLFKMDEQVVGHNGSI